MIIARLWWRTCSDVLLSCPDKLVVSTFHSRPMQIWLQINQLVLFGPILQVSTQQVSVNRRRGVCSAPERHFLCNLTIFAHRAIWPQICFGRESEQLGDPTLRRNLGWSGGWGQGIKSHTSIHTYLPITPLDRYSYVFHEMNNSNTMRSSMNSYLPKTPRLYSLWKCSSCESLAQIMMGGFGMRPMFWSLPKV